MGVQKRAYGMDGFKSEDTHLNFDVVFMHRHHRIGVEVVRFETIICIRFNSKVTNDKFWLRFHH